MTFRGLFPCLLVLTTFAMLTWHSVNAFAQYVQPGNNSGVAQPGTTGTYNPQYQQPASGFPTSSYPNTVPGTGVSATATATVPAGPNTATGVPVTGVPTGPSPATGPVTTGTTPQNYMIPQPLGAMPNEPQQGTVPGNPPPAPNSRPMMPPPDGYNPSKEELEFINRFLAAWHEQSKNIEALDYDFTCWDYRGEELLSETYGRVKFRAPDQGLIEIDREKIGGEISGETNKKQKFICTGDAVYVYDFADKKLTEFIIPAEDHGKGVMDSPLMILVGANPRELQERFYLLVLKTPASMPNCIHLQAWPKWVEDAREFKCVNVAIDRQTFHANALLLYDANGEGRKAYQITQTSNKRFQFPDPLNLINKDEFDRNKIVGTKPKDWVFETKTDFLPEASGQQLAQQPNPAVRPTPAPVNPQ